VGRVVAVGPGVPSQLLGRFMVLSDTGERAGCFGEYRVVDLRKTYAVPVPKAKPEYATMMVTGVSIAVALNECAKLGKNETVLITAAAGSGGTFAVQIAKQKGNHVIGTCGGEDKVRLLRELGCDRVINYREEDVGEVLAREYPDGVDLVLDSVGGDLFDTCVDHLAVRGRLVVFGYISDYKDGIEARRVRPVYDRLLQKSAEIRGFAFKHYAKKAALYAMGTTRAVVKKKLRGVVDPAEFVGVDAVVAAVEHHHQGKNLGKVVVRFE
jgi:NADPH-dependent curcumin reductase CurA